MLGCQVAVSRLPSTRFICENGPIQVRRITKPTAVLGKPLWANRPDQELVVKQKPNQARDNRSASASPQKVNVASAATAAQAGETGTARLAPVDTEIVSAYPEPGRMELDLYENVKTWGPRQLREHAAKLERFARQMRRRAAQFPKTSQPIKWLLNAALN